MGDTQGKGNVFVNDLWPPVTAVCVCVCARLAVCSRVADASGGSPLCDRLSAPRATSHPSLLFSQTDKWFSALRQQSRRWRIRTTVPHSLVFCPPLSLQYSLIPHIVSTSFSCPSQATLTLFYPHPQIILSFFYLYQPLALEQWYGIGAMLVVYH